MKQIPLTQGKFALVDDEDYDYLMQWKWHYSEGYAARSQHENGKPKKTIRMHREIMDTPDNLKTDHRDGNGINNQKYNLRNATNLQNSLNKKSYDNSSSKYKGVCWSAEKRKYISQIKTEGKVKRIGTFSDEVSAAMAYDKEAKQYFGEFARLNFPDIAQSA